MTITERNITVVKKSDAKYRVQKLGYRNSYHYFDTLENAQAYANRQIEVTNTFLNIEKL